MCQAQPTPPSVEQERRLGRAMEASEEGECRQGERAAAGSRRREMAAGLVELDSGAHGLPQHVEELGRPAPPPSEPHPAPDLDPAGARGGIGEQEERRWGGATEAGGERAREKRGSGGREAESIEWE
jgi:hypothetical protein